MPICNPSQPLVAWFKKVHVEKRTAKAANNIQCYSLAPPSRNNRSLVGAVCWLWPCLTTWSVTVTAVVSQTNLYAKPRVVLHMKW